jgi:hypothetical protein
MTFGEEAIGERSSTVMGRVKAMFAVGESPKQKRPPREREPFSTKQVMGNQDQAASAPL